MHGGHMEIGQVHTHQLVQILIREDVWDDRVCDDDYNGFDNEVDDKEKPIKW